MAPPGPPVAIADAMSSTARPTNSATPALDDVCPRCGGGFHCGVADGFCDCFGLALTEATRREVAERYPGQCLCIACLKALSEEAPGPMGPPA